MSVDFIILSMRDEHAPPGLGRHKTLKGLRDGLSSIGCSPHWLTPRVPKNRLLAFAFGIVRWIGASVCGHPLPIQAILALQGCVKKPSRLRADIRRPDPSPTIIYVDGVRLAQHGVALRTRIGGKLLIDFDDLMSRRAARMLRDAEDISFGAFVGLVPDFVTLFLQLFGPARTFLLRWEKRLLRRTELEAARTADAIALTSAYEARLFQRFQERYAPEAKPIYLILGPSTCGLEEVDGDTLEQQPPQALRFIFIGSDTLSQNRVAIEEIIKLAREDALALPVFIYGRMTRKYAESHNVSICGFVETLATVYRPGSILLLPRSVRGGIKSKVLEAFEHGIPTLGTSSALEGFEGEYPWRVDGIALRRLVGDIFELRKGYHAAVAAGRSICQARFSSRRYWRVLSSFAQSSEDAGQIRMDL